MRADEMKTQIEALQELADDLKLIDPAGSIAIRYACGIGWEIQLFSDEFLAQFGDSYTTRTCDGHLGKPFQMAEHVADGVRFIAVLPESAVQPVREAS